MKKSFIILAALLMAFCATAQEPAGRHDFELTLGEPSALLLTQFMYHCGCGPAEQFMEIFDSNGEVVDHLEANYRGQVLLPSVNLKYHYNRSEVFSMGVLAGYNMRYSLYEMENRPIRQQDHNLYALFSMRWHWLRKEQWQVYSGVAVGAGLEIYNKDHDPVSKFTVLPLPALQLTFFGFKVGGGNTYWTAELGYGDLGFFNTGIGFRF